MDGKHLGARKDFKLDVSMYALQIFPAFLCYTWILMAGIYEHVPWLLMWLKAVVVLQVVVVGWKKQLEEVLRCTSGCTGVSKTNFPFLIPSWKHLLGISLCFSSSSGCRGLQWDDDAFLHEHILSTLKIL